MNKSEKTAIILIGGGMKCSYSLGAVLALSEVHKIKKADIVIAGSGGATIAAYFVTQQFDYLKTMWESVLHDKKFLDPKRIWEVINIDYFVDEIVKKHYPLDEKKLYSKNTKLVFSATNSKTGIIEFFENDHKTDMFNAMKATEAIPIAYGKKVEIHHEFYIDTYVSSIGINMKIKKAVELGAKKILIISTRVLDEEYNVNMKGNRDKKIFDLWLLSKGKKFRENYLKQEENEKHHIDYNKVKIVVISPKKDLRIRVLSTNHDAIEETIHQGYQDTKSNKQIKKLFKKH